MVTSEQLMKLVAENPVPEVAVREHGSQEEGPFDLDLLEERLKAWLKNIKEFQYEGPTRTSKGNGFMVICPGNFGWPDGEEHNDIVTAPNGSAVVWVANGWPRFRCSHNHCDRGAEHGKKTWLDLQRYYDPQRKYHRLDVEPEGDEFAGVEMDDLSEEDIFDVPVMKHIEKTIDVSSYLPAELEGAEDKPVVKKEPKPLDPEVQKFNDMLKQVDQTLAELEKEQEEERQAENEPIEASSEEPDTDTGDLTMPESAMYGKCGVWARDMKMPLGLAYPAVLGEYSIVPQKDELSSTRINLYVALLAVVGGGKNVAIKRARQILSLTNEQFKMASPVSDRGVMTLIGDKPPKRKGGERVPGPRKLLMLSNEMNDVIKKMAVNNSTLASTLCDLWDENQKVVPDRQGEQTCDCRLSWVGGIPVDPDSPEEFSELFGRETAKGLVSRMLFGYSGTRFNYREWTPPQDFSICEEDIILDMAREQGNIEPIVPEAIKDMWDKVVFEDDDSGRLKYNMMKVMLLTAAANGDREVTKECVQAAIVFMKWQQRLKQVFQVGMANDTDQETRFTEILQRALEQKGAYDKYVDWRRLMFDRKWNLKFKPRVMGMVVEGLIKNGVLLPYEAVNEDGKVVKRNKNKVMLRRV